MFLIKTIISTMTTPQARFTDACVTFLQGQILPPLVDFLRTKNCTVTVQELAGALQLPTPTPAATMQGVQVPTIPGFTQTAAPVAARGKGKARPAVPYNGPTCQYLYKRGKNAGQTCGEPALPGKTFCKNCDKKRGGGGTGDEAAPAGAPAPAPQGGFRGFSPAPVAAAVPQPQPAKAVLDAFPIPGQPNFFKEKNHGFIIQQTNEGTFIVRGIEKNGAHRPSNQLSDAEKQVAHQIGLVLEEATHAPAPTQPPQGMPQLPQIPGMPQLPPIPGVQQAPQAPQGMPQLPQIPGMPQLPQGMPQLPQIPGMPQFPGMPQIPGMPIRA